MHDVLVAQQSEGTEAGWRAESAPRECRRRGALGAGLEQKLRQEIQRLPARRTGTRKPRHLRRGFARGSSEARRGKRRPPRRLGWWNVLQTMEPFTRMLTDDLLAKVDKALTEHPDECPLEDMKRFAVE